MFLLLVISIGVVRKDRGEIYVLNVFAISTALLAEVLSVLLTFMETFSGIFETLVLVLKNDQKRFGFFPRDEQIELMYFSRLSRNICLIFLRIPRNLSLRC